MGNTEQFAAAYITVSCFTKTFLQEIFDLTECVWFLTFKETYRRWLMTKEAVLKDFPGIPNDALLAYFLFSMGRSAVQL